jgi:predicted N-acetyltransferase YhbS
LIQLAPLASVAPAEIEHLLDLAFGPDRRGRTAYRLREGVGMIPGLSFAAIENGALIGSIQCWPVQLTEAGGHVTPLILVGPVAVRPDRQRDGIGRLLMLKALAEADRTDSDPMMLIGDAIYYERFFGFSARHTQGWAVPGPVDRHRLLARLRPGQVVPSHGAVEPRRAVALDPALRS